MVLGGNQPYFLPYIGFWQLVNSVDVFCICDDFNYIKQGWIARNRILNQDEPMYFKLELKKASQNKKIMDIELNDMDIEAKLNKLHHCYKNAPFYNEGMTLAERIFKIEEKNLALFLTESMKIVSEYLNIQTPFVFTSSLKQSPELKREYRVFDMCEKLGADQYCNAVGGQKLYNYKQYREHNIELSFLKRKDIVYKQFDGEFVPDLSILDVIMFNSKQEIEKLLSAYVLLKEVGVVEV